MAGSWFFLYRTPPHPRQAKAALALEEKVRGIKKLFEDINGVLSQSSETFVLRTGAQPTERIESLFCALNQYWRHLSSAPVRANDRKRKAIEKPIKQSDLFNALLR